MSNVGNGREIKATKLVFATNAALAINEKIVSNAESGRISPISLLHSPFLFSFLKKGDGSNASVNIGFATHISRYKRPSSSRLTLDGNMLFDVSKFNRQIRITGFSRFPPELLTLIYMFTIPKPSSEVSDVRSSSYSVFDYVYDFAARDNFKTTIILLYAVLALTAWKYIPSAPHFADPESGHCVLSSSFNLDYEIKPLDGRLSVEAAPAQFLWNARKIWAAFFIMGIVPALIVKFIFKEKLSDYGLTFGIFKRTLVCFFLFFPAMLMLGWLSGNTREFYNVYPYNPLAGVSWLALILHSFMYLFLYYLAWEFMFRGFIQLGLTESLGAIPAVLIQVTVSTMLHYGHPASEVFGCIAGGVLWGFLVYRTKSLLSGWGQHAILGIALDWSLILKAV